MNVPCSKIALPDWKQGICLYLVLKACLMWTITRIHEHYASVNSSCAYPPPPPPPPGNCRAFARIVSPGGQALAYPRATPGFLTPRGFWLEIQTKTILSEKTSSLSLIGLSVKDWTKLWRFLKVCLLNFRHFLIVYHATTLKLDRERSLWLCISRSKRMRRYPGGGAFALFFRPHPQEFATQNKRSANARGLARGGGGGMGAAGIDWCIILSF